MERFNPFFTQAFLDSKAGIVHPLLVEINALAIRVSDPYDLGHGFCQGAEFLQTRLQPKHSAVALGDIYMHDDSSSRTTLVQRRHHKLEPALFCGRVAGIFERESPLLSTQHRTNACSDEAGLGRAFSSGTVASLKITYSDFVSRASGGIRTCEMAPRFIH